MSCWFYRKEKRELWAANVSITGVVFALGIMGAMVIPLIIRSPTATISLAGAFVVAGVTALCVAKLPRIRQGVWTSWGTRQPPQPFAHLYWIGYGLIGSGFMLAFLACKVVDGLGRTP